MSSNVNNYGSLADMEYSLDTDVMENLLHGKKEDLTTTVQSSILVKSKNTQEQDTAIKTSNIGSEVLDRQNQG